MQVNLTLAHELEAGSYDAGEDDLTIHNLVFEEVCVRVCVCVRARICVLSVLRVCLVFV